ncbi:hypothetical protein [Bradyrhizobium neotropicale]|uniref:hypothetical protein n=1 Tax=Bradyrhizobium neotropicale TaxID=1497615 RepID=UPI001AD7054F|nr:hypothetical protein [Bradyrhizobium neotropicale]MBO4224752.1 hypothetical protein [Bradyrhizobium neotropicale]
MKAASFLVMASVEASHVDVWERLTEALDLAGANVGKESSPQTPEKLSGIIEHVEQDDRQRYILLRLSQPAPGIALVGTYGVGDATNASMALLWRRRSSPFRRPQPAICAIPQAAQL